jgi:hypothetical protein
MTINHGANLSGVVDRANDAIRDNPLAAGLIGLGIAWMIFGGAKGFGTVGALAKAAATKAASAAAHTGNAALKAGSSASSAVKDGASGVVDSVASIVPDLTEPGAETVGDVAGLTGSATAERLSSAAASGREFGASIQSRLSEGFERQPLLLGVVGLAIGAGIASTFATTAVESKWLGTEKGMRVRESLEGVADEAKSRARRVFSDVREEVERQGLTAEAAKEATKSVVGKAKAIAGTTRESVTKPFRSS